MVVITLKLHVLYLLWLNPEYLLWGQCESSGEMSVYLQNVMISTLCILIGFQLWSDSLFPSKVFKSLSHCHNSEKMLLRSSEQDANHSKKFPTQRLQLVRQIQGYDYYTEVKASSLLCLYSKLAKFSLHNYSHSYSFFLSPTPLLLLSLHKLWVFVLAEANLRQLGFTRNWTTCYHV